MPPLTKRIANLYKGKVCRHTAVWRNTARSPSRQETVDRNRLTLQRLYRRVLYRSPVTAISWSRQDATIAESMCLSWTYLIPRWERGHNDFSQLSSRRCCLRDVCWTELTEWNDCHYSCGDRAWSRPSSVSSHTVHRHDGPDDRMFRIRNKLPSTYASAVRVKTGFSFSSL